MNAPNPPATAPVPTVRCYHCLDQFAWDQRTVYITDGAGDRQVVALDKITDPVKRDEALLNAWVLCPNQSGDFEGAHYLPLGYVRYLPPIVIGMVGRKDTGKSTLLATIVEEIVRGNLTRYGFTAQPLIHDLHPVFRQDRNKFMNLGTALTASAPAEEQVGLAAAFLLTKGSVQRPIAFFDVGGESLGDSGPEIRFIQAVSALIFVIDPDQALGLVEGSRDQQGRPSSEGDRAFNAVLSRLSRSNSQSAQFLSRPAAIVLAKADLLRFEPVVSHWLRQADTSSGLDPERMRAESRDLYGYLYEHYATAWLEPFKHFRRCTLHAVSATGGRSINGKYRRGLRSQRVLDPLVAILAMAEVIDGSSADRVGK
jgi:hypothetical protein